MKDGFGLGFGSAIAHRVVGGLFGSSSAPQTPVPVSLPATTTNSQIDKKAFDSCMEEHFNNYDSCKKYLEGLN